LMKKNENIFKPNDGFLYCVKFCVGEPNIWPNSQIVVLFAEQSTHNARYHFLPDVLLVRGIDSLPILTFLL